ncbi:MAG: PRC-barrel domain-containing protein [Myxococcota bacterium]
MQEKVTQQKRRLAPLGELEDYRVKEGNPDIRGWEAYGADSLRIGEVRELIVDTAAMKARYMVLSLDRTLPNVEGDRRVIVPIGRARLDDALDRVYLDDVTIATAHTLPVYDAVLLDAEKERSLFGGGLPDRSPPPASVQPQQQQPAGTPPAPAPPAPQAAHEPDFYNRPEYDDKRFFGRRKQDVNEAYVVLHQEQVTVEPIGDSVAVIREQVTVERYPVGGAAPRSQPGPDAAEQGRSEAEKREAGGGDAPPPRETPKKEPV